MNMKQARTTQSRSNNGHAHWLAQSPRTTRRGSALLIVIGTLALISVFAAIYISIGRTDRRAANATRTKIERKIVTDDFSEYFLSILGSDRMDAYVQYDSNNLPFGMLEATDAPYTDWTRRSEVNLGTDSAYLFTPTGRPYEMGSLLPISDFRVASDPWLSSTTPVYLGNPGIDNADRPFSNYAGFDPERPNQKNFLDNRDWLQISNFAPDGRFVNLFNLRSNRVPGSFTASTGLSGNEFGGFNAEPGIGYSNVDGRSIRRMSNYLSLMNVESQGDPQSILQAFDPAIDGVWIPGQNMPIDVGLTPEETMNTPAVWTMYQRFMLMPMNQPFASNNRMGQFSSWADPDYPAYQYADANGDGFADSRWFELTSAQDLMQGGNTQERDDIELLYDRKELRYFLAAKAIDLSSIVNVNTATAQLLAPTVEYPMGLTPADVDLRRLLTMQDAASDYTEYNNLKPLSYAQLHRPYRRDADNEPLLGEWNVPRADRNYVRNVTDYRMYQHDFAGAGSDPRDIENVTPSMLIGRYAFDALRQGIMQGSSLTGDYQGYDSRVPGPTTRTVFDLVEYERGPFDPMDVANVDPVITAEQRYDQYINVGLLDPTNPGVSWGRDFEIGGSGLRFGGALYGMNDLAEILTFYGLNDPEVTSRLERVMMGRYASPNNDELQTQRMSPLLSNRPLSLDRQRHGWALDDLSIRDPGVRPNSDENFRSVNGRISFNSMAHLVLTPRNKITMISGSVPLVPTVFLADPSVPEALTASAAATSLTDLMQNPQGLFGVYSKALVGELQRDALDTAFWPTTVTDFPTDRTSTLYYGYHGAELAARIAAHAAVNMKDLADGDSDTTVATIMVDNNPRTALTDTNNFDNPGSDSLYELYPGVADGNLFDLGQISMPTGTLPDRRQAVNVYGFEAMPVLTEVSVLYAYTDSPESVGGDQDYDASDEALFIFGGGYDHPVDVSPITINGDVSNANSDFLIQVLAFQLHNPYDKAISLGGNARGGDNHPLTRLAETGSGAADVIDTAANYQFEYYIEYAGRYFKVAKYLEWYPTDQNAAEHFTTDLSDPFYSTSGVSNPANTIDRVNGGRMDIGSYDDFVTRNVMLQPQETRVFYAIADKRFDDASGSSGPDTRWTQQMTAYDEIHPRFTSLILPNSDVDGDGLPDGPGDDKGWTGPAEQWVEHQFSVYGGGVSNSEPVMMMEFDPTDGSLEQEGTFENLLSQRTTPVAGDPSRVSTTEARLWKKIVSNNEESNDSSIPSGEQTIRNLIENDLLVDRMQVDFTDLTTLAGGDTDVPGTVSYAEDYPQTGSRAEAENVHNDNTGITVAQWKTFRRADSETMEEPELGAVTPWMMRSKSNITNTRTSHIVNFADGVIEDTVLFDDPDALNPTVKGDFEIQTSLRNFWDLSREPGQNAIVQTIGLAPHLKSHPVSATPDPGDGANGTATKFGASPLTISNTALDLSPTGAVTPLIFTGGDHISTAPRLADLLLAWGIGPSYSPDPNRTANSGVYEPDEWVTATEALAIAMGVEGDPDSGGDDEAVSIWFDAYDSANTNENPILEDGRLSLDRFIPFINTGAEVPPIFDQGSDFLRGQGIPMALGVIDQARPIDVPFDQITDPSGTGTYATQFQALSRPTFGSININTAPVEVLRLLPGLSPSRAEYNTNPLAESPQAEWIGTRATGTNLPTLATAATDLYQNPDVASAIVAYRDRLFGSPNTAARSEVYAVGDKYSDAPLNLTAFDPMDIATNMREEFTWVSPMPGNVTDGLNRSAISGIENLRGTPGFASLGELLTVAIDPDFETSLEPEDVRTWDRLKHLSIQQYGYDDIESGIDGSSTIMSQVFNGNDTGDTIDDYAERISMANAVLNTLTVRSDFFAVWFVVHGYQESDVSNLRPEDPMIPTVQKRYLMVVDRSNVIEPGDQPKILVLKEVPI